MQKLLEKFYKIFQLEGSQGYENRAVMGGMRALAKNWQSEARENAVSETLIPVIASILNNYPDLVGNSRRQALLEIGDLLQIPQIETLPPYVAKEVTAKPIPQTKPTEIRRTSPSPRQAVTPRQAARPQPEEQVIRSRVNTRLREIAARPMEDSSYGLDAPVSVIRGVGEKQASHLLRMGIRQIKDLLYLFPRRYDDYSKLKTINQLQFGEEVTILAKVISVDSFQTKKGKRMVEAVVSDTTGALRLLWMNQDWHVRYLKKDLFISISGKIDTYLGRPVIWYPDYESIDQQQLHTNRIVPVYPLTAKITQRWLRRTQFNTVRYWAPRVSDFLNDSIREKVELLNTNEALLQIHFPENQEALEAAQRRFAFDEIFLMQLGILQQKRAWQELEGTPYFVSDAWLEERLNALPYQLTASQRKAVDEIRADLSKPHPMNRLLQGDVGSGKTVVAVLGMLMVIESDAQAAIMAPTSILAEQHYLTISSLLTQDSENQKAYLEPGQVRLLTGDTKQSERNEIFEGLESGYVKILIGTHALIEDPVVFKNLQIAVIDEQHRFGVAQRAALRNKGDNPHLLVMTATPIPRSLQFTIFGDLDVSIMDELPAGRKPILTYLVMPMERERIYKKIRDEVKRGYQAFIIYPLVEAGENENLKAAVDEQERLQREVFPDLKVALVHGRLRPAEKDEVMIAFRNKEFDILVSTSVVEVGVDIPNATVMAIEGANHFGLSQLHQFRGRVGRGDAQSYCFLIPDSDNAFENKRLNVMTQTNDGFVLAEEDLKQRGPGDFLGTRQAGALNLQVASLADTRLIKKARDIAEQVLAEDPDLENEENLSLKDALETFWPQTDGAGDVS